MFPIETATVDVTVVRKKKRKKPEDCDVTVLIKK